MFSIEFPESPLKEGFEALILGLFSWTPTIEGQDKILAQNTLFCASTSRM